MSTQKRIFDPLQPETAHEDMSSLNPQERLLRDLESRAADLSGLSAFHDQQAAVVASYAGYENIASRAFKKYEDDLTKQFAQVSIDQSMVVRPSVQIVEAIALSSQQASLAASFAGYENTAASALQKHAEEIGSQYANPNLQIVEATQALVVSLQENLRSQIEAIYNPTPRFASIGLSEAAQATIHSLSSYLYVDEPLRRIAEFFSRQSEYVSLAEGSAARFHDDQAEQFRSFFDEQLKRFNDARASVSMDSILADIQTSYDSANSAADTYDGMRFATEYIYGQLRRGEFSQAEKEVKGGDQSPTKLRDNLRLTDRVTARVIIAPPAAPISEKSARFAARVVGVFESILVPGPIDPNNPNATAKRRELRIAVAVISACTLATGQNPLVLTHNFVASVVDAIHDHINPSTVASTKDIAVNLAVVRPADSTVNVRAAPGMASEIIGALRAGQLAVLSDESVTMDGHVWRRISVSYGVSADSKLSRSTLTGWAASDLLDVHKLADYLPPSTPAVTSGEQRDSRITAGK